MTIIPFPEWLPDQPDFNPPGSSVIRNCTPMTAKSYGPMPTPQRFSTNTLDERCQGAYAIKDVDGAAHILAGDRTKLYHLLPGSESFSDASRSTGGAYATPSVQSGGFWSMTAYGKRVIASNYVDAMQTMLMGDPRFVDMPAGAPKARFVVTVKDFLFAANTQDPVDGPVPFRCWWSGLGLPTSWPVPGSVTALQQQSDYQDLQSTDLGPITGLAAGFLGASDVAIFTERGIWTGNFVGPPTLFQFKIVAGAPGTVAPLSIVSSRARTANGQVILAAYYLGEDGFAAFDGTAANPIGAQKFDREFLRELNGAYRHYVQGIADPLSKLIFWGFASENSTDGLFDRVLAYNWELGRAVVCDMFPVETWGEWVTRGLYANAYNLDELDPFGDVDSIRPSFDDPFWIGNGGIARASTFTRDHALHTWVGPAMAPRLDLPEMQPYPGRRAWVTNARPLIDGGALTATVQVGRRERLTDPVIWETQVPINMIGDCPQRATGRYVRFRFRMPPAQAFSHLQGLDVTMAPEGRMR